MNWKRSLHHGWDYQPDWRLRLVESYLVDIASAKDRSDGLQDALWREPDPYIRQALRYRFTGICVHQPAIEWAFRVVQENEHTGLASRIRAAVIADRFPEEIATMISVEPALVVAFEKLFWDVRPHLGSELWLETLVENEKPKSIQASRETVWLRTALHEGWEGLERLWLRRSSGTDAKSLDELAREIEGIAARRALRHMQQLEERDEPVSDDDLKRLVILSRRAGSASAIGANGENGDVRAFYAKLLDTGTRNMLEMAPHSPKTKALELVIGERLGLPMPSTMPVRRRMRTLSCG
jgi:hypothetical protein